MQWNLRKNAHFMGICSDLQCYLHYPVLCINSARECRIYKENRTSHFFSGQILGRFSDDLHVHHLFPVLLHHLFRHMEINVPCDLGVIRMTDTPSDFFQTESCLG